MEIDPKRLTKNRNNKLVLVIPALCLSILFSLGHAWCQLNTGQVYKKPGVTAARSTQQSGRLLGIRLGTYPKYSRLVFLFDKPTDKYVVKRPEVDELWVDFGLSSIPKEGKYELQDEMVAGVAVVHSNGRMAARIKVQTSRFS
ncbi:MAG: hypothetical protein JRI34_12795, partial [Deltaproteobacteria bacterium]|nr:hypothetical protein [Deltaproteobacteria bacterium]